MKLITTLLLAIVAGGCSTYTEAQMQLTQQVRRAADLCRQAQQDRTQVLDQYYQMQQSRLDAGFDADVRQTPNLSADWVVEHRKAYSTGVEAVHRARAASAEAEAAAARNFAAIDSALQRLLTLQGVALRLPNIEGLFTELFAPAAKTTPTK